jgi:hypothetical protein
VCGGLYNECLAILSTISQLYHVANQCFLVVVFFACYTLTSNDIPYGVTLGFIFSTVQSAMSLSNLEILKPSICWDLLSSLLIYSTVLVYDWTMKDEWMVLYMSSILMLGLWWGPCCSSFLVFCVVFFALFVCVACVPNVASFSGLWILDCPFSFSGLWILDCPFSFSGLWILDCPFSFSLTFIVRC